MYAIEMKHISKRFGGMQANDDVTFCVKQGEIHSLLGENGAGKTTLMNILFGMYRADEGTVCLSGKEVRIESPTDAIANGISMVHQHFMQVGALTVAENVVLGCEPVRGLVFDRERAFREVEEISEKYHLKVDAREKVENLSVGIRQRVEILKALYRNSSILILDEPTAVLTPQEVTDLFLVLRKLKEDGKSIVIITHKLKETMNVADQITVLRKGKIITSLPISEVDEDKLAELMVGRRVLFGIEKKPLMEDRPVILSLQDVTVRKNEIPVLDGLSLEVRKGEILGIAGVEGNGQTELIEVITGLQKLDGGKMLYMGNPVLKPTARKMLDMHVGHIPEDRGKRGLIRNFTVWESIIQGYQNLSAYVNRLGILRVGAIKKMAAECVRKYDIRCDGIDQTVGSLSGGNQQKVIIVRVLMHEQEIVVAAQPTRGVDIGAIEYIHSQLMKLRDEGKAVILISADLEEILKLSDDIAVLYEGKIVAHKKNEAFTENMLGSYMLGQLSDIA
ncbi:Galactose/methyl galactoside import ATP-binding protein MglA [bioreactor metagenome]|uniref:Galactose/methyl galactoside import ATP-binding protein MglA n=1 Tax=bioreactor metagenome TaxID=1076179 RepID=A0A644Y5V2_9ZZZZ